MDAAGNSLSQKGVNSIFSRRVRIGCVYFSFRWTWEREVKVIS